MQTEKIEAYILGFVSLFIAYVILKFLYEKCGELIIEIFVACAIGYIIINVLFKIDGEGLAKHYLGILKSFFLFKLADIVIWFTESGITLLKTFAGKE